MRFIYTASQATYADSAVLCVTDRASTHLHRHFPQNRDNTNLEQSSGLHGPHIDLEAVQRSSNDHLTTGVHSEAVELARRSALRTRECAEIAIPAEQVNTLECRPKSEMSNFKVCTALTKQSPFSFAALANLHSINHLIIIITKAIITWSNSE